MTAGREPGVRVADERRDAQIATVVLVLSAAFALRLLRLHELGLVELVPVGLAGWWFGGRGALRAAAAAGVLLVAAVFIEPDLGKLWLIPQVALVVGAAIVYGRLVDDLREKAEQLRQAEPVQNALAPARPPDLPLLDVAARYIPASAGVGGDFYLIAEGHNNASVIVVADVVGKGMDAARRATFVRATLSAGAGYSRDPAHLLRIANAELVRQYGLSAQFITMLCLVVHPDASVEFCTAGHPPPLSLADGAPLGHPAVSLPLGIAPDLEEIDVWQGTLPEAGILMYTDGLSEARPPTGTFPPLGHERIGLFLRELDDPTPAQAVERLANAAYVFSRGQLPDDLCIVALRSKLPRRW